MQFEQINLRGAPCYVRPAHVAAIRPARAGESGASTVVLSCGVELSSPFDVEQLRARLTRQPPEPPPFDLDGETWADLRNRIEAAERADQPETV